MTTPLHQLWDIIRPQSEAAFWASFAMSGYERQHLKSPPTGEDGKEWALAKIRAFRACDDKTEQLFEKHNIRNHPEILSVINDRNGMECPF